MEDYSTADIDVTEHVQTRQPGWFQEAVMVLTLLAHRGLPEVLAKHVRVERGKTPKYTTPDFILLIFAYAVSHHLNYNSFDHAAGLPVLPSRTPTDGDEEAVRVAHALMATWKRNEVPHRSAVSRWLAAVASEDLKHFRALSEAHADQSPLTRLHHGGLIDRAGRHHLFFDLDPTGKGYRQRHLVQDELRPQPNRRAARAAKRGRTGRHRGEVVRTRTVLQQSHTGQLLGSWGKAGNADHYGDLEAACLRAARYLEAAALPKQTGWIRDDGAYGFAKSCAVVAAAGLNFMTRCADYRLLKDPAVEAALAGEPVDTHQGAEGGPRADLFAVELMWRDAAQTVEVPTCLVVLRRVAETDAKGEVKAVRVGKLKDGWHFELFAVSAGHDGLLPHDVVELYAGRGAFEAALGREDQDCDPDRTLCNGSFGKGLFDLVCQWVSNLRLEMAVAAMPDFSLRQTLWALPSAPQPHKPVVDTLHKPVVELVPALDSEACAVEKAEPVEVRSLEGQLEGMDEVVRSEVEEPTRVVKNPRGGYDSSRFTRNEEGQVYCPAGEVMEEMGRREGCDEVVTYQAAARSCELCPQQEACRGGRFSRRSGRRVSFRRAGTGSEAVDEARLEAPPSSVSGEPALPATPSTAVDQPKASSPPGPVIWIDLPGPTLTHQLTRVLADYTASLSYEVVAPSPPGPLLTRDQRAHRRLTYQQHHLRNHSSVATRRWTIRLSGIPSLL